MLRLATSGLLRATPRTTAVVARARAMRRPLHLSAVRFGKVDAKTNEFSFRSPQLDHRRVVYDQSEKADEVWDEVDYYTSERRQGYYEEGMDPEEYDGEEGEYEMNGEQGEYEMNGEEGEYEMNGEEGENEMNGEQREYQMNGEEGEYEMNGEQGEYEMNGEEGENEMNGEQGEYQMNGEEGEYEMNGEQGENEMNGEEGDYEMNEGEEGEYEMSEGEEGEYELSEGEEGEYEMNQEMEDEEMFHEAMEAIDTGDVLEDPEESAELSAMDDDLWNLDASKIGEPHTKEEFANIFEPFPNELQVDDQVAPLVRVVPESSAFYMQNMEYMEILVSLKALERKYKHLARLPEAWRIFQPISQKEYLEMGISDKPITYHEFMGLIRNLASIRPDVMPAEVEALVSRFARNYLKAKVDKREPKVDKMGRSFGKGKRKESIARVWIVKGRGDVLINGKTLADTFVRVQERERVAAPLRATGMLDEYNVFALVEGGGKSGQAGALQLGLSRALRAYNPGLGKILYDTGYLKMDLRRVERKKPATSRLRITPSCGARFRGLRSATARDSVYIRAVLLPSATIPRPAPAPPPLLLSSSSASVSFYASASAHSTYHSHDADIEDLQQLLDEEELASPDDLQQPMVSLESLHPQQQLPLQDRALLYRPSSYVPTMDSPAIYDQQQHQQHQPGAFSSVYYPNLPQQQPLYLATFPQDDFTTAPNYSALGHFPAEPVAQPPPLSYSPVVFQQPQLPPQQLQQPVLTVAQLQEMLLPLYRAHFPDSSIPTALPAILSHLLFVTRYLALNVVDLGLASDSLLSYDSRLQFWRLFNRTWINLLARAHNTHATANIVALSRFQLDECAVDIVALADNLQQYGLVDYELGVWEDRIIEWIMTLLNSIPE